MITQNNGFNATIVAPFQWFYIQLFAIWHGKATEFSGCLAAMPDIPHFHQMADCLEMAGEKAHG